jgi:biopolymer transport protein ExbD
MLARLGQVLCWIVIGFASVTYAAEIPRQTVETVVQADGSVRFDGQRIVGSNAIGEKLQALAAGKTPPILRLVPNRDVSYQAMYSFLEAVRKAGLQINITGNVASKPATKP